jgi:DhnA family fructose-bisphosphate aldolase class Ia
LILAADHRARGVITIERYASYLEAVTAALASSDGILASTQPLRDLAASGAIERRHRTYLSLNRTGLAGSAFELDDRSVASVERAATEGFTGVKHMTRIDMTDPVTAGALELLGKVLEEAHAAGLEVLVEALTWRAGKVARDTDSIVFAAVVAHDLGSPVLKVPVPDVEPGNARVDAVARIVASVGVPVLFLGGPPRVAEGHNGRDTRDDVLDEIRDAMAGGAAGMAVGRVVFQDRDPATMARLVAHTVHNGAGGGSGAGAAGGTVPA